MPVVGCALWTFVSPGPHATTTLASPACSTISNPEQAHLVHTVLLESKRVRVTFHLEVVRAEDQYAIKSSDMSPPFKQEVVLTMVLGTIGRLLEK